MNQSKQRFGFEWADQSPQRGFTLIELSIVLVIIGLIVGGVLIGRDLIKAAEIRATVSQIEKFNAAALTFRGKYNGLPGDVPNPARFGLEATGATGAIGFADGNGLIHGAGADPSSDSADQNYGISGENKIFWRHLAQSNLISENITNATIPGYGPEEMPVGDETNPRAKLGRDNRLAVSALAGLNYFYLGGLTGDTRSDGSLDGSLTPKRLTPNEAFQIDVKLDDGIPHTGIVVSTDGLNAGGFGLIDATGGDTDFFVPGVCYDIDAASPAYFLGPTSGDSLSCNLRIRTSF